VKLYSLRRATFTALIAPMLVALVLVAVSGLLSAHRAIDSLRDHEMAQEAAFLMTLALHEVAEGEKLDEVRSPEAYGLDQIEKQGTGYRVWSGNEVTTSDGTLPSARASAPQGGFADIKAGGAHWRRFVMRHPQIPIAVEVAEPESVRSSLMWQMVGSLVLPMLALILAVSLIASLRVAAAMRPMDAISRDIAAREAGDLAPLAGRLIPREIAPLVDAIDDLMRRLGQELEREREFTDNAAHELRTPLAALKMRAQLAEQALAGLPEHRQTLAALVPAIDRVTGVVEQLLLLSRLQHGREGFTRVDLSSVVEDVARDIAPAAIARGQSFDVGIAPNLHVRGNPDALAMVVRNLVENAVRHGKEAGFVQVTLSSVDGRVVLRVLDDGPGIPEDKLPLAFERFTRFATDGAGSGLGLSIVERIAEIHDATVTLRNRAEEGLVCEMSLSGAGLVVSKG